MTPESLEAAWNEAVRIMGDTSFAEDLTTLEPDVKHRLAIFLMSVEYSDTKYGPVLVELIVRIANRIRDYERTIDSLRAALEEK